MAEDTKGLIIEECLDYLNGATFRIRAPSYGERYPKWPGAVGIEVEMIPVTPNGNGIPIKVPLQGKNSSTDYLSTLASKEGWRVEHTEGESGTLVARIFPDPVDNITFEPGGQVEIATKPYPCLSDSVKRVKELQSEIEKHFATENVELCHLGINPWHTVDELGLQMPKARYQAMNQYYSQLSEYGPRMMRQTCTIQVNLDFGENDSTLAKRYLAGMLLAPFGSAIFTNSPVVDRKYSGIKGFRRKVWRFTDPTHTGVPGIEQIARHQSREVCLQVYLDYVMKANVVFVEALGHKVLKKPISFKRWLEHGIDGVYPTLDDFKTHLSLMFTEVRPRGFLEIRSIDCQPKMFQAIPARFYCGLLYDADTLDELLDLLTPISGEIEGLLQASENGLDDPRISKYSKEVMELAIKGFANLPTCFKEEGGEREFAQFYTHFTGRGRTPADDFLDVMKERNEETITLSGLKTLNERWSGIFI
jgi:glutamate--cysteine ligase